MAKVKLCGGKWWVAIAYGNVLNYRIPLIHLKYFCLDFGRRKIIAVNDTFSLTIKKRQIWANQCHVWWHSI